jgi:hypothetical protein
MAGQIVSNLPTIVMASSMDATANSMPCSQGVTMSCMIIVTSLASIVLSTMTAGSAADTQDAVTAMNAGGYKAPRGGLSSFPAIASECAKPNPPKYLCGTKGLEEAKTDLNMVDNLAKTGQIVLSPEQQTDLDTAKGNIDKLIAGATKGGLESDGNQFSDYASASAGRAGAAIPKGIGNGSEGGTGGSVGWVGSTSGGLNGRGGGLGKTGPTGAYLDKTDWNGQLDMINPNTGKSLTIWERATRRYMGTPDGQRGYTMARIESLRKKSTQTIAAEAEKPKEKAVAKQEEPRPYVPVVMSPKEFSKH